MTDAFHRLASFLTHGDYKGICTLCQATHDGQTKWFCRLSRKVECQNKTSIKVAIHYGDDIETTVGSALDDVLSD